jgi:DNA polymerase-3 subunit epsilon
VTDRPAPRFWVALDVETTGLFPETDRIVELSAVRFDASGAELGRFDQLINPRRPVGPGAYRVHGISDAELATQPDADAVLPHFLAWLGEPDTTRLVAHNAGFDAGFLGHELARLGIEPPDFVVADSLDLARRRLPQAPDHRLETLATWLGLPGGTAHRALADSLKVMALWLHLDGPSQVVRSYPIPTPDPVGIPPQGHDRILQAIRHGAILRIRYEGGSRGPEPREISPRRFVRKGGLDYLVALCHLARFEKAFRLDRIAQVEVILPGSSHAPT